MKVKKILNFAALILIFFVMALPVFAQEPEPEAWQAIKDQMQPLRKLFGGQADLRIVIANLLKYLLSLVGLIFMIYIVYAGISWMTAAGNEDKIRQAKSTLQTGVIGMAVIIFAYAIARFVIIAARCATDTSGNWCAFLNNIVW